MLAIVNSVPMNSRVHVSFWIKVSIDICLGLGLRDNLVALFLVFQGTSVLFSIVAILIYIPRMYEGPLFFKLSPEFIVYRYFLMIAILTSVSWYFIVVLSWISLIISVVECLFMCLLAISVSSLLNYLDLHIFDRIDWLLF